MLVEVKPKSPLEAHSSVKPGIPRVVEVSLALFGLILFAPILFLSAIAIVLTSRGPAFFRQERVGRGGRKFIIYKLRTMRGKDKGAPQITARGDSRVTPIGRILRKTKLDELPELWNVGKGDMSLVGPRPEVPQYVDLNSPGWRLVLSARPGITDPVTMRLRNEEELLAQVQGDHEKFYREILQPFKLKGYQEFLCQRNCWEDVKVLWHTGIAILIPHKTPSPITDLIMSAQSNTHSGNAEADEVRLS